MIQGSVNLLMNSLYGVQIRREIDEFYKCISEHWIQTEYDENVIEYCGFPNGNSIVKSKKYDGLESNNDVINTLPSHPGAFIFSNSKRIMNIFIEGINGFYNNNIYYVDTVSF